MAGWRYPIVIRLMAGFTVDNPLEVGWKICRMNYKTVVPLFKFSNFVNCNNGMAFSLPLRERIRCDSTGPQAAGGHNRDACPIRDTKSGFNGQQIAICDRKRIEEAFKQKACSGSAPERLDDNHAKTFRPRVSP